MLWLGGCALLFDTSQGGVDPVEVMTDRLAAHRIVRRIRRALARNGSRIEMITSASVIVLPVGRSGPDSAPLPCTSPLWLK